jgi:hypothetical protein
LVIKIPQIGGLPGGALPFSFVSMRKLILLLLIVTAGLSGCKKNQVQPELLPAKGSISGVIQPAGAATGISASVVHNGLITTYQATIDAAGVFKFTGLEADVYVVNFLTTSSFAASSSSVTVLAGQNTDMGNITFSPAQGSITGTVSPVGVATGLYISYTVSGSTIKSLLSSAINAACAIQANLQPGTYTISFGDVPGYVTPPGQTITVSAGKATDLGTVTFLKAKPASISGSVTPAGAATSITISRLAFVFAAAIPAQTYTVTTDGSGHFSAAGLDAAYYYDITVNPVSAGGLVAPNKIRIFLPGGQDVDLGSLELTATAPPVQLAYSDNGTPVSIPLVTSSAAAGQLSITQPVSMNGAYFGLVINQMNGTGDYPCNGTMGSRIILRTAYSGDPIDWQSNAVGGDGLIRITAFDPVHQTVSGTFTATLAYGANVKKITNGAFVNVHYSKP